MTTTDTIPVIKSKPHAGLYPALGIIFGSSPILGASAKISVWRVNVCDSAYWGLEIHNQILFKR